MPLPGIPFGMMTSNAETRSDETINRRSPRSNVSRTLPRRKSGTPGNSIRNTGSVISPPVQEERRTRNEERLNAETQRGESVAENEREREKNHKDTKDTKKRT